MPHLGQPVFTDVIREADRDFETSRWAAAESKFDTVLNELKNLSRAQRAASDPVRLNLRRAACRAYTQCVDLAGVALDMAIGSARKHESSSTPATDSCMAEVVHLRAQVHLQEDELDEAKETCAESVELRERHEVAARLVYNVGMTVYTKLNSKAVQKLDAGYALAARIYELMGNTHFSDVYLAKITVERKYGLRRAYSKLTVPDQPALASPIAARYGVELMPTCNVRPPGSRTTFSSAVRVNMLKDLDIHTANSGLQAAIIFSDLDAVIGYSAARLAGNYCKHPLKIAALFGEAEIAEALLDKTTARSEVVNAACDITYGYMDATGRCRVVSSRHSAVTALHLACAAQQEDVIRLLVREDAALGYQGEHIAAPLAWLLDGVGLTFVQPTDPLRLIRILKMLVKLGWDPDMELNQAGETMLDLVTDGIIERMGSSIVPVAECLEGLE